MARTGQPATLCSCAGCTWSPRSILAVQFQRFSKDLTCPGSRREVMVNGSEPSTPGAQEQGSRCPGMPEGYHVKGAQPCTTGYRKHT